MSASPNHHFATAFKNSCLVRPRKPDTQLPMTDQESAMNDENTNTVQHTLKESDERLRPTKLREDNQKANSVIKNKNHRDQIYEINDLPNLLQNNDKFYKHLQELRRENKKTLKMLENFYRPNTNGDTGKSYQGKSANFLERMKQDEGYENSSKFIDNCYENIVAGSQGDDFSNEGEEISGDAPDYGFNTFNSANYEASSSYQSSEDLEEDPRRDWTRNYSLNVLPDESNEAFRGRLFSYEVIDNMWDDFSVDSYDPVEQAARIKDNAIDKKEWSPSITIPEPFKMSLRVAAKAKTQSKRKQKLEEELLQKRVAEEAELNKKFRAKPAPATTFMQLFKEIEDREEDKRQYRRSLNKAILEATQKPFDFIKREEVKKELRRSQSFDNLKMQEQSDTNFKAKPFPSDLFNLSLEDKRAEQEEYRKIKIKMRSQETLASSSLPPNMRARGERYTINNRYAKSKHNNKSTKSQTFRPRINHEIPDYEELHKKFESDLLRKRRQATPTICEPFNLHTANVPSRSSQRNHLLSNEALDERSNSLLRKSQEQKSYVKKNYRPSTPVSKRSVNESLNDEPPPFALTETARLRHSKAKQTLNNRAKAEEDERKLTQQKKRREDQIRKQVARKSAANDMKSIMQQQSKEKLQSFRESDLARAKEYKQYLKEIKAKVQERPLLFEQESQTNAKRTAQRRYKQILHEAGVEDDVVNSLVTEDGHIIDAESDEETGDLLSDEKEAEYSTLPRDEATSGDEEAETEAALNETHSISVEDVSDTEKSI